MTRTQLDALKRIRDFGSTAWDRGTSRCGGAVARMFERLARAGLVSRPPFRITPAGRRALREAAELARHKRRRK